MIYANNINGSGLPNGVTVFSNPIGGGVNEGVAANSTTFSTQSTDGSGNLTFLGLGVALLPGASYAVGDTISMDATLTLAVDPMASLTIDPFILDPNSFTLPLIGAGSPQSAELPEPSSAVMGGTGAILALGYFWHRRRQIAA